MDNELKYGLLSLIRANEMKSNTGVPNLMPWVCTMACIIVVMCLSMSGTLSTIVGVFFVNRNTQKELKRFSKSLKKPRKHTTTKRVAMIPPQQLTLKTVSAAESTNDGYGRHRSYYHLN